MAEPGYWTDLYREVAARWMERFDFAVKHLIDVELPAMLERAGPEQRMAVYANMDFEQLRVANPYLWQKLSADALALEEKRRADEAQRLSDYEAEVYDRQKLLQAQIVPYGRQVEEEIGQWPVNLR